jgi:hypothetical protein
MPLKAPSKSGNGGGKMAMPMADDEFGDISSDFKGDDFDDFDDDEEEEEGNMETIFMMKRISIKSKKY